MTNKDQILKISRDLGLSHVGSCISVLPILEEIYAKKNIHDKVILDGAHAHVAHMVVKHGAEAATDLLELDIKRYGIHCDRAAGCDATGGSLGHGIGIGIGIAKANPDITVHVIVTDGSIMEGSGWEALRLKQTLELKNLKIYCNFNSYTAVAEVKPEYLFNRLRLFDPEAKLYRTNNGGFGGVEAHYIKL